MQFYANEAETRKRGESEFGNRLVDLEVRQILALVRHLQTDGKLERLHGEIQCQLPKLEAILVQISDPTDLSVPWHNYEHPQMSLNYDEREAPWQAFQRNIPPAKAIAVREQTKEECEAKWRARTAGIPHTMRWVETHVHAVAAERKSPTRMRQRRAVRTAVGGDAVNFPAMLTAGTAFEIPRGRFAPKRRKMALVLPGTPKFDLGSLGMCPCQIPYCTSPRAPRGGASTNSDRKAANCVYAGTVTGSGRWPLPA